MPAVAPLVCSHCGSPVPVGKDLGVEVVACRACGADVEVPAPVAELRAAGLAEDAARREAQALADELTRPPGPAARAWMAASTVTALGVVATLVVWVAIGLVMSAGVLWHDGPAAAVVTLFVGLLLAVPLVFSEILHLLAPALGADLVDTWSGAGVYALFGLWLFVFVALPLIVGTYNEGFEEVRATLRKLLAAKPPRTEGGPAECRACGAALEVVEGTLYARCLYCAADNLVNVPPELLARAVADAERKHADVASARAETIRARRDGIRIAVGRTWRAFVVLILLSVAAGRAVAGVLDDGRTFWSRAVVGGPLVPHQRVNPYIPPDAPTPIEIRKTYDTCDAQVCDAYYLVALDAGEVVVVETEGLMVFERLERREIGKWYDPTYTWVRTDAAAGAPYRGWYRVVLRAPLKLRPKESVLTTVRWSRRPAPR